MSLIVRFPFFLLILLALLWSAPAMAQRIQFPTTISPPATGTANTSPNLLTPPSVSTYQSPTATYPPSSTFSSPNSTNQPLNAYAQQAPGYSQPAPTYGQPAQGYSQPAQAYPQQTPGTIQPAPGSGYGQSAPAYSQPAPAYAPPGAMLILPLQLRRCCRRLEAHPHRASWAELFRRRERGIPMPRLAQAPHPRLCCNKTLIFNMDSLPYPPWP